MARYAVGDLQGCLQPLQCLLEEVAFDPAADQLWLVGDLVNRGPQSLDCLRFVRQLGDSAKVVLGNHDLHMLAVSFGALSAGKHDNFDDVLAAPDRDELLQWLMQQPLLYSDPSNDYHMCHAGIPPNWNLSQAQVYAAEVATVLRSKQASDYFTNMYGNQPNQWQEQISGWDRLRLITNYLTRMRFCTARGELEFAHKLNHYHDDNVSHDSLSQQFAPWFSHPQRLCKSDNIIFGHWAALEGKVDVEHVFALDTGCVWGNHMTMMRLEDQQLFSCECSSQGTAV
ncbi:MAG: bis(5'-nucleosyl)-tetraphosphatase (symmetrical) [Oceanicoccus sp.]|jgi:bis(5'-nucleosyl)-tetraphosphatase (symmetrical)